jgi:hypothetical protein
LGYVSEKSSKAKCCKLSLGLQLAWGQKRQKERGACASVELKRQAVRRTQEQGRKSQRSSKDESCLTTSRGERQRPRGDRGEERERQTGQAREAAVNAPLYLCACREKPEDKCVCACLCKCSWTCNCICTCSCGYATKISVPVPVPSAAPVTVAGSADVSVPVTVAEPVAEPVAVSVPGTGAVPVWNCSCGWPHTCVCAKLQQCAQD